MSQLEVPGREGLCLDLDRLSRKNPSLKHLVTLQKRSVFFSKHLKSLGRTGLDLEQLGLETPSSRLGSSRRGLICVGQRLERRNSHLRFDLSKSWPNFGPLKSRQRSRSLLRGLELNAAGDYTGGFFALLNPYSLVAGLLGLTMFAVHGALFLAVKTGGETQLKARAWAAAAWPAYALLFFVSAGWTAACYLRNGVVLPLAFGTLAVVALALIRAFSRKGEDLKAFFASCAGIAFILLAVVAALFPNLVVASNDQALSLTIYNSSSSLLTLKTMLVIALLGMPVVIGYTVYIHRIFKGKV